MTDLALDAVPAPVGLDPADTEFRALLVRSVPIATVIDLYDDTDTFIADIQAKLQPAMARRQALYAILDARMRDEKATKLAHPAFEQIEILPGEKIVDKRIDVLKALLDLENPDGSPVIPAAELSKAIWTETPAPVIKTHMTYLKKLSAYGARVQEILAKGIVESFGPPRLVLKRAKPVEKNVTSTAVAS
jgi:hypothetical protein